MLLLNASPFRGQLDNSVEKRTAHRQRFAGHFLLLSRSSLSKAAISRISRKGKEYLPYWM
jgi:hypothetical protein